LNRYLDELERTGNSLMVYSGGRLIFQSGSKGIRPHLEAIDDLGERLRGSVMVDKIVGRAAALLILYSGAAEAHIKMLDGRIYCPFEAMVQGLSDPGEAYRAIVEKITALKEQK
jgi:hypothetical protein